MKNLNSFLSHFFEFDKHKTKASTEVIAGITTFFTMIYIVLVNPAILSGSFSHMDAGAVFVLTCIVTAFACILMGVVANLPIALAPAMGLNVYFATVICLNLPWQVGMGVIFWGSILFFILSLFKVRMWLMTNIPLSLRAGISAGIGLFIAFMGFKNMRIIDSNPATFLTMGDIQSLPVILGAIGLFIIIILAAKRIHAAILISIIIVTILGLIFDPNISYNGIVSLPPSVSPIVGEVKLGEALNLGLAGMIFSVMIISLFDSSGTILAVADKAGLSDENGKFPRMRQALLVDSFSSTLGGLFGTSSVLSYIESSSGVAVGGKTGFTAVIVGLLFLCVVFFSPVITLVPTYATSGALIFVGILMTSSLVKIQWDDLTEAAPAFITALMMPFTFAISEGIALGFISYAVLKLGTGRWKELNICVSVIAVLFIIKFIFIPH